MNATQKFLALKNCKLIVTNLGQDAYDKSILMPIAKTLLDKKSSHQLTSMYVPLRLCGFAYKVFEYVFGDHQEFFPGYAAVPANQL